MQAYKYGEGKKIDGRKIVVDFERGRTQLKWRPRRLGGGLGETRRCRSAEHKKDTKGEEEQKRRSHSRSARSHSPRRQRPRRPNDGPEEYKLRLKR